MAKKVTKTHAKDEHISLEDLRMWYSADLVQYQSTVGANAGLDSKQGVLIAAILAIGTFADKTVINSVIGFAGCVFLVFAFVAGLYNLFSREHATPANGFTQRPDYYNKKSEDFILQMMADAEDSISKHTLLNEGKSKTYTVSVVLAVLGVVAFILASFINVTINIEWM